MGELYLIPNGASAPTTLLIPVTTGTAIKTMLQVKLGAAVTVRARVVEWGISFDGAADAAKVQCELMCSGAIAATVTAHVAAGIVNLDPNADAPTDDQPFDLTASAATGYTASAEGTITVARLFDPQLVSPAGAYVKQFPLGREPMFDRDEFLRIRVDAAAAVNCDCYVIIEV